MLEIRAANRGVRGMIGRDSTQRGRSTQRWFARGTRIAYALAADTGYNKLSVLLDGRRIAPSGTVTMSESHFLSAASDRIPRLVPQNQAMYDLLKQMLAAPDPRPLSHRLLDEVTCAYDWYGGERTEQLEDDARQLVMSTPAAVDAFLKMQEKIGGDGYSPKCTKPRPGEAPRDSVLLEISAADRGIRGVVGKDSIQRLVSAAPVLPRGTSIRYVLAADTGFDKLSVLLDGHRIAPSGTIIMSENHLLSVTAERVPRLVPQNQAVYDILKQMMAAPDPRLLASTLLDEMTCVDNWYGEARGRQLYDDAVQLLTPTQAALEAYLRMHDKLGGAYSPKCTKPRPRDATTPLAKPPGGR